LEKKNQKTFASLEAHPQASVTRRKRNRGPLGPLLVVGDLAV